MFSADHTSQYGFSMGHPLRGFDLTEDTERGGVKAIARHRLSPSDHTTWSRPSNTCLCSCFRGSIRIYPFSPSIISLRELFACVSFVGTAVYTFISQWDRPKLSLEFLYVHPYLCVRTHACMQCTPHRQTGTDLTDLVSGKRMCLMHVSKTCTYACIIMYLLSIH